MCPAELEPRFLVFVLAQGPKLLYSRYRLRWQYDINLESSMNTEYMKFDSRSKEAFNTAQLGAVLY